MNAFDIAEQLRVYLLNGDSVEFDCDSIQDRTVGDSSTTEGRFDMTVDGRRFSVAVTEVVTEVITEVAG